MKNRRIKWQKFIAVLSLITLMLTFSPTVKAETPYDTYSVNGFGQTVFTQPAYEPVDVLGQDIYIENDEGELVHSPMSQPKDLFIANNDNIYIADSGNNRILHLESDGTFIREITLPDSPLRDPSGIFITEDQDIYIADTGNRRIVKLDPEGNLVQEFLRPESNYIDDTFVYEPTALIVDSRDFVYAVSRGTFQGIIQFSPEGEFYGFYGTNITEVTFMDRIRNIFYSEEQLRRQVRLLPNPIINIAIDNDGYIYTVSNDQIEEVKKLNIRGENQWESFTYNNQIDLLRLRGPSAFRGTGRNFNLRDIAIDNQGIVTVIDSTHSIISQFNRDGEVIFFWGSPVSSTTSQMGIVIRPSAVDVNSRDDLFILDESSNLVQVLRTSEFGGTVREAFRLTESGDYAESERYWREVIRQNALFTPAHDGLARSAFYNGDYEEARELYERAGDEVGYSDSFWQLRLVTLQGAFPIIATTLILLGFAYIILRQVRIRSRRKRINEHGYLKKKPKKWKKVKILDQLSHAFYTLTHPIDGFDDIRFANKGGYLSATIILILVAIIALARIELTSFTFRPVQPGTSNAIPILFVGAILWITWVIGHYLIGSIRQGQARFKDIFVGSAYALFPVALMGLPLALLSNVMTLNEGVIYNFVDAAMIFYCIALFFWMVMTLQNYTVGETINTILLSLFTMVIAWVIVFIVVGLSAETIEFIVTIYREVTM